MNTIVFVVTLAGIVVLFVVVVDKKFVVGFGSLVMI